ncbi:2237_t:CDS:2 [Diversispora eburnea]|uniref:tRNA:m(4)X modification enzyme TRM13 n=1 Tax=Diversispora eburnea TaxID=1213867 RepID=A0A9N8ZFU3_9GLOM|nr:2237_t:CDS:2 [Diversispora eburnea]
MPKELNVIRSKRKEPTPPLPPENIENKYCGEHLNYDTKETIRERIPCPYDLSHKCNSRPKPNPPYFTLNINCTLPIPQNEERFSLSELNNESLKKLIANVNNWYDQFAQEIKTLILDHEAETRQMARLNLLQEEKCFIEFGSGKGELSYFTKLAVKDHEGKSNFILIDRKITRCKFDSAIRDATEKKSIVKRIEIDIKDLDLSKLDIIKNKKIVAFSKHLCGSATDITLKSLVNYSKSDMEKKPIDGIIIALCCHQLCQYHMYPYHEFLQEIGITKADFKGICAMSSWAICGQRPDKCKEDNNENKDDGDSKEKNKNLIKNDDEEEHFYHDSMEFTEEDNTRLHYSGLDYHTREALGYKCKRILDFGRYKYLKENGFETELIYYVEPETSLENLALIAIPIKTN